MNLLIFVLSLLMILSAMTYARLDSFMKSRVQAGEWRWVMKESERDLYNQKQKICNAEIKKAEKKESSTTTVAASNTADKKEAETPANKPSGPTTPRSGLLNPSWLLNKEIREKEGFDKENFIAMIEDLMNKNWGNQPFFKRMESERPDFVSALIKEMIDVADKANKKDEDGKAVQKVVTLDDLIMRTWSDQSLKNAFGHMLQVGLVYNRKDARSDENSDISYVSPQGFQSLNDYFATKNTGDKIRVWLAPRAVLKVLFPDPAVLEEVIKMRAEINKEVKKGGKDSTQPLTDKFQEAFQGKSPYSDFLDFTVSTTDTSKR